MKKDVLIAIAAIAIVAALCFGLNAMRLPLPPTPSQPYAASSTATESQPATIGHVVMHVNGEAVTEEEFNAAFQQLPEQLQQQFASEIGKQALAERIVRLKLLEQEGRRRGLEKEPRVAAQVALSRTNALADVTFSKMQQPASEAAVTKFYEENRAKLESIELNHILLSYAGSEAPPRDGGARLTQEQAIQKALQLRAKLKQGGDFAALAKQYSDDAASGARGGSLGEIAHGMLPPELDKIVFELPVGEVSQPVPSRYGIHIFKVTKKQGEPNAQIRSMIAQRVAQQDAMQKIEAMRKSAKIDFDAKFFPNAKTLPVPPAAVKNRS
ncbi:MAG: peptidyl-prolyl cis-trans isomerase [Acidobacteriota bacterium]|jgi:parvulin-like peptidyl-prolyl isomerase|nr:peptidyl-prolyl cis-trans isomerase [Acidobacteriota bacterium]